MESPGVMYLFAYSMSHYLHCSRAQVTGTGENEAVDEFPVQEGDGAAVLYALVFFVAAVAISALIGVLWVLDSM
jgi:hypothetical protein